MKRLFSLLMIALLAVVMISVNSEARRKKEKSGTIENNIFTDKNYGFTIELNDKWKANRQKNSSSIRLILIEKNYLIPNDYRDSEEYTKIPRIVLWVDTTSADVSSFLDSLLSDSYESDQKSTILKEFEILSTPDLIPRDKKRFTVNNEKAVSWQAKALYITEVATSSSSLGGKRVNGAFGGGIVGFKKGDVIMLFHIMCEFQYFKQIYSEAMVFINSVKFPEAGE